jgi:hypothetical protein
LRRHIFGIPGRRAAWSQPWWDRRRVALPLSDFGNSFNIGFNGTIAITRPLVPIAFRGDVAYNQFSGKGTASNVKAKVASVSANAVWGLPG